MEREPGPGMVEANLLTRCPTPHLAFYSPLYSVCNKDVGWRLYFVSAVVRNVIYVPTTLPLHPISS